MAGGRHRCRLDPRKEAVERLEPGELAIGRIDVRPSLDGVEPGLLELVELRCRGVVVLNRAAALLAAHDKLRTSRLLVRAGVRHPPGRQVEPGELRALPVLPVVVKPRFGSWGSDVFRCDSASDYSDTLAEIAGRAMVQTPRRIRPAARSGAAATTCASSSREAA